MGGGGGGGTRGKTTGSRLTQTHRLTEVGGHGVRSQGLGQGGSCTHPADASPPGAPRAVAGPRDPAPGRPAHLHAPAPARPLAAGWGGRA